MTDLGPVDAMTTDYRAMCADLIDALDSGIPAGRIRMSPLVDRARAALAQPEPVPPTDEELIGPITWMIDDCIYDNDKGEIAQSLRELIARWGRHTIQPVAVSERLPGPGDCDAEGRCWWVCPPDFMELRSHATAISAFVAGATHWLPAHALPTPEATNG